MTEYEACKKFVERMNEYDGIQISDFGLMEPNTLYNPTIRYEISVKIKNSGITLRADVKKLDKISPEKFLKRIRRKESEWNQFYSGTMPKEWIRTRSNQKKQKVKNDTKVCS